MNTEYIGLGFWCLTQLSISTIFQLCRGSQFYCWRIPVYPEKTTYTPQVTDKLLSEYISWLHQYMLSNL